MRSTNKYAIDILEELKDQDPMAAEILERFRNTGRYNLDIDE